MQRRKGREGLGKSTEKEKRRERGRRNLRKMCMEEKGEHKAPAYTNKIMRKGRQEAAKIFLLGCLLASIATNLLASLFALLACSWLLACIFACMMSDYWL